MLHCGRLGGTIVRAGIGVVVLAGSADAAAAGTGRLVSRWMSRAPRIDAQIETAEWRDAATVDLGSGVTARIGNDARTLYLAVLDPADATFDNGDGLALYFDDEG